jgi:hypothetical protein
MVVCFTAQANFLVTIKLSFKIVSRFKILSRVAQSSHFFTTVNSKSLVHNVDGIKYVSFYTQIGPHYVLQTFHNNLVASLFVFGSHFFFTSCLCSYKEEEHPCLLCLAFSLEAFFTWQCRVVFLLPMD